MLYLSGHKSKPVEGDLAAGTIGLLLSPNNDYTLDAVAVWAADNGAFTDRYPGDDAFMVWLKRYERHRERCLFVAAPDVVGDATATLELFPLMATRLRDAGWPVALVGQDGMELADVPWHLVDWLFVGGSTEWKLGDGATTLIRQAQAEGKRVHVGRVNSARRFGLFAGLNCDTADGTFLAFGPDKNLPAVRAWSTTPVQGVIA